MPKGLASNPRSGPPPDPNALRRDRDEGEWRLLPAAGREGEPPPWPLGGRQTIREKELWVRFWSLPQAVMWERQSQFFEVGLYVRRLVEAEQRGAAVNLSTLVRQMSDSLGLTTPGLRMNRWRIDTKEPNQPAAEPRRRSARDRLTVVPGAR